MKYLEITLHDNDFYNELESLGKYLTDIIATYSDVFDLDTARICQESLKRGIVKYLAAIDHINSVIRLHNANVETDIKLMAAYIDRYLRVYIVDQDEIQRNCDSEVLYVPICTLEDLEHGISWFIV